MADKLKYILLLLICLSAPAAFAQFNSPYNNGQNQQQRPANFADTAHSTTKQLSADQELDTIRNREERSRDSVIFTSKFIKVTNERLLRDSTQVFPLDTGLTNFENYSPLYQPGNPKISLGHLGLDARDLLFSPPKP